MMKLQDRIRSALELVDSLRAAAAGDDRAGIAQTIDRLADELAASHALAGDLDLKLGVLDIISRHHDPEEALATALGFVMETLGVEASGIRLREGDDFPYFTTRGFGERFVEAENHLCRKNPDGSMVRDEHGEAQLDCMCGTVIRGRYDPSKPFFTAKGSFWTNSTTELLESPADELGVRTRNRCHNEGYESVALIPLRSDNETFGLVQFNDHRQGLFTARTVTLLEELAGQLARLLV